MQSVNIQTAQNVGIKYEKAGIGDRIAAFLIDGLIQLFYIIGVAVLLNQLALNSMWIGLTFYLPVLGYHLICEAVLDGQSIGKKQMNIKVVDLKGTSPGLGSYLLRWMLRPIDITMFSGGVAVLSIAITDNGQRLGDLAAGTTVIKIKQTVKVSSHQLVKNLQVDYTVTFPQVERLTDQEIDIIKEVLKVNKERANSKPAVVLADKLKSHLEVSSDLPPIKFLYTVVKDYQFITSRA